MLVNSVDLGDQERMVLTPECFLGLLFVGVDEHSALNHYSQRF